MECHVEASPRAINLWRKAGGQMLLNNDKHNVTERDHSYKSLMQLRIRRLTRADFGTYHCSSKNSHGEAEGTIQLYGKRKTQNMKQKFHFCKTFLALFRTAKFIDRN